MHILRTLTFNLVFFGASLFWSLALLWVLVLPRPLINKIIKNTYFRTVNWAERYILGLNCRVEGLENLPQSGGYVLAAKHQSAFETLKFPFLFDQTAIVLKRELTWIPLWGWYPRRMGMIPIDRGSARVALKSITDGAQRVVDSEQRPLIIFPQGTRVAPGDKKPYKTGIAHVYKAVNAPVVPVALNSGLYWGKNSFWKKPGTVTLKFLPPIPPGLEVHDFMLRLEDTLETESDALAKNPDRK
ncbi:MAG: lysophospholipid acyltransferase family protein [Pseudomonadota bacterium]